MSFDSCTNQKPTAIIKVTHIGIIPQIFLFFFKNSFLPTLCSSLPHNILS